MIILYKKGDKSIAIEIYFITYFLIGGRASRLAPSGSPHAASPGFNCFPQYPQVIPSLLSQGLWDAHVPLNSPFLIKRRRTESSTKKRAKIPMLSKKTVIWF
jgi:hypothetical protein